MSRASSADVGDALRVNAVGDLELTDPAAMRALAEPTRLALFDRVRRGTASASVLSELVQEPEPIVLGHLAELQAHGFVTEHDGKWTDRPPRGLSGVMMLAYDDLPRPGLPGQNRISASTGFAPPGCSRTRPAHS